MHRRGLLLAGLILAPLLAGCFGEEVRIALRVPEGQTFRIQGDRHVDGSIVVERGATLVLDHADLDIEQALIVDGGTVTSNASMVSFVGVSTRHELRLVGTARFVDTTFRGMQRLEAVSGSLMIQGGRMETGQLVVGSAHVQSVGTAWDLASSWQDEPALLSRGGSLVMVNGTLAPGPGQIHVGGGEVDLRNLTVDLRGMDDPAFLVDEGHLGLTGVTLVADADDGVMTMTDGLVRLLDTPLPRHARHPVVLGGRFELAWTLTVRVLAVPGNTPLADAHVTLQSAHAPGMASGTAVTDERGEARLEALQYVVDAEDSRPGNPHVVRADAGGRTGASPAMVLEAPAIVLVPVGGAGYATSSTNQLSGSQVASLPSR